MADERRLANLAQEIKDGLFGRNQPGGPGAERDSAIRAMADYLKENGYVISLLTIAEQQQQRLAASLRETSEC